MTWMPKWPGIETFNRYACDRFLCFLRQFVNESVGFISNLALSVSKLKDFTGREKPRVFTGQEVTLGH